MNDLLRLAQAIADRKRADGLDLCGEDLRGFEMNNLRMADCKLDFANLAGTDWSGATLRLCAFNAAQLRAACFDDARAEDSAFIGADLADASFRAAQLSESSFERALLRQAVFDGAAGEGLIFRGADLRDASLRGVAFEDADFRGADLRGADLSGARLVSADFRGALLDGACLTNADCARAEFDRAPARDASTAAARAQAEMAQRLWQHLNKTQPEAPGGLIGELLKNAGVGGDSPESAPLDEFVAMMEPLLRELEALSEGRSSGEALNAEFERISKEALTKLGENVPPLEWERLFGALGLRHPSAAADPTPT